MQPSLQFTQISPVDVRSPRQCFLREQFFSPQFPQRIPESPVEFIHQTYLASSSSLSARFSFFPN